MYKTHDAATARAVQDKKTYPPRRINLRSPGLLGKFPVIGVLMVLLGSGLFGVIVVDLQTHGPLAQADTRLVNALHTFALQSSLFIRDVMILGFYAGEHLIVLVGVVLALYYLSKRYWPELSMVLIGLVGEGVIWFVLSRLFDRPRPTFDVSVWRQMAPPSFPSGHTFGAVLCYGLLAYVLVPDMASYFWKILVTVATVLFILYIGFSRVFVGDHFPTDVLAGYALGIMWAGFVYTSIDVIAQAWKKRHTTRGRYRRESSV